MHGEPASVSHVIFGLPPLLVSLAIFVATYAIVISEKLNRAVIAALGWRWFVRVHARLQIELTETLAHQGGEPAAHGH